MAVTIGVATGGALLVESRRADEPAQGLPAPDARDATPSDVRAQCTCRWNPPNSRTAPKPTTASTAITYT